MDRRYRVIILVDSSLKIKNEGGRFKVDFNVGDIQANCHYEDIIAEDEYGTKIHKHIQIEVELYEEHIDKASELAADIADFFLSLACFSSGATVSIPKVHIAYDITPNNVEDREFIQFFYRVGLPFKAKRSLEFDKFDLILKKAEEFKRSDRLGKAIRWYRKSLLESDKLDRFIHLWFALESLNPPIKDKFNLNPHVEKCPNCQYERNLPTAVGIRHLITNHINNGESIYKEAIKARRGLVHGNENLREITPITEKLIPNIEYAVKKAILLLLDITKEEHESWLMKPLTNIPDVYIKVGCLIHQKNVDELTKEGQHPHFKDEYILINSRKESDGKITFTSKLTLTPVFKERYTPQFTSLYGPEEGINVEITG